MNFCPKCTCEDCRAVRHARATALKQLDVRLRAHEMVRLRCEGLTHRAIGDRFGLSTGRVAEILNSAGPTAEIQFRRLVRIKDDIAHLATAPSRDPQAFFAVLDSIAAGAAKENGHLSLP